MAISSSVCESQGHKIESIRINPKMVTLPGHTEPLLIDQFQVACTTCGLFLEEIQKRDAALPKRVRKPKSQPATQETA